MKRSYHNFAYLHSVMIYYIMTCTFLFICNSVMPVNLKIMEKQPLAVIKSKLTSNTLAINIYLSTFV